MVLGILTSVCVTKNNNYFVNWKSGLCSDFWEPTLHKEVEFNCTVGSCQENMFPFYTDTKHIIFFSRCTDTCSWDITSSQCKMFKGTKSVGSKSTEQLYKFQNPDFLE